VVPKTVNNNHAREIIYAGIFVNGTTFHGAGKTAAVTDKGLDIGVPATTHLACAGCDMMLLLVSCKEASDP
jgi:hypothetical protein